MTDELKPCPCGGEARIVNVAMVGCSYVVCTDCRMQSDDGNIDSVVTAWNTRADLATPLNDPRVKAVVEAAKGLVWAGPCHREVSKARDNLLATLSALEENK